MNKKKIVKKYCNNKKLEINTNEIKIIESIDKFYNLNFNNSFISNLFSKNFKIIFNHILL